MARLVLIASAWIVASAVRRSHVIEVQSSPIADELGHALKDLDAIFSKVKQASGTMSNLNGVIKKPSLVEGIDWSFADLFASIPEACERTMGQFFLKDLVVFSSSTARIRNLTDWLSAYKYHVESAEAAVELAAKDVRRAAAPGQVADSSLTQDQLLWEAKKLEGKRISELLKADDSVHTLHVMWARVVPEAERLGQMVAESAGKCANTGSKGLAERMASLGLLTETISDSLETAHTLLKEAVSLVPHGASMLEIAGSTPLSGEPRSGCPVVPEQRESSICNRLDKADYSYRRVMAEVERVELEMAMIVADLMDDKLPAASQCQDAIKDLDAANDMLEEAVTQKIQAAKFRFKESRGTFEVPSEGLALTQAISEAKSMDEARWKKVKLAQESLIDASREFSEGKQEVLDRLLRHTSCDDEEVLQLVSSRIKTIYKTEDSLKAVVQIFEGIV